MSQGWISLHRKFKEHWLWKEKRIFSKAEAWIDILMECNHAGKKVNIGNQIVEVKRGQKLWSIKDMASKWGWSRKKVSNFLNLLEKDSMIKQKRTSKYTLLTVENYNIYQNEEHQKNINSTSKEHQKNTNNNDNNDNKYIYTDIFDYWNEKGIIKHRSLTDKMKRKIKSVLKDYDIDTLKEMIDTYAEVVLNDKYWFTHKWTLEEFLQRGITKFEDREVALHNYLKDQYKNDKPKVETYDPYKHYRVIK